MHRALAAIVVVAMCSTSASAVWQHVHAYAGHEHAEHHHAPAAHAHDTVGHAHDADSAEDHAARLKGCDPGGHAVSAVFTCIARERGHAPVPGILDSLAEAPLEQAWNAAAPSDVRAHSPPRLTDAPLRAPPVVHLA